MWQYLQIWKSLSQGYWRTNSNYTPHEWSLDDLAFLNEPIDMMNFLGSFDWECFLITPPNKEESLAANYYFKRKRITLPGQGKG